jgi:radical SAM superfamily enzyme YgiQ (UPF0313 family)
MNILLINPPDKNLIQSYAYDDGSTQLDSPDYGKFPPLGLLYIAAYLEKYTPQHKVFVIDCVGENIGYNDLETKIKDIRPDLAGITSFSIGLIDVVKTAGLIKKNFPSAHVCMGGHHPMAFPKEALGLDNIDSIIIGDGEEAFCKLALAVAENKTFENITGLYGKHLSSKDEFTVREDSRFLYPVSLAPAYTENIDALPFPARKYLAHINYFSIVGVSKKFTTIVSSRGCPYHCIMCDVPYKKYRARSIKNIVDEIEHCVGEGYEEFHFYDDMFNITAERIVEFSNEIIKRNLKVIWDFRGRVNGINEEALRAAKQAGLRMISFGVETGTDEGLKFICKAITVEMIKKAFDVCNKLKIKTIADFMIGFPFEKTEGDINKNIKFCMSLAPTYGMFSVLILYPNTPVYDMAVEKKLIDLSRWHKFVTAPTSDFYLDYWEEFFTRKQLLDFKAKAYKRFYLRPGYIWQQIKNIASFEEFKRKVKGFFVLIRI